MKTTLLALLVATAAACSKPNELETLTRQATAIAAANQPKLDALVARVRRLRRDLRGDRSGWENMLRTAELANDVLGLQPFTQTVPPGPSWRPSPASLLGIADYVGKQAHELARHRQLHELRYLVEDERRRYEQGIADVDRYLSAVESWLAKE